ncbi:MAG TPA: FAD-binding oxidoreductase [Actinomycetes bacterium]|nr:FAD-binding oxidoreductase [Actinomycetes bacterium]
MSATVDYAGRVRDLQAQYAAIPPGEPVRLAKRTSNLFRTRTSDTVPRLDVTGFDGVLSVDPERRTADVLGMTTYEHLVDALLPYGFMPLVVPELKTITLGGAVAGVGIESTSFRSGFPHESVLEMDVLTGDGRVVTASPTNEHAELFRAFPNSYGTLGYALRLRIDLEQVHPYVELHHHRFEDADAFADAVASAVAQRTYAGSAVDFLDGTVFGPREMYLSVGSWAQRVPAVSDYTGNRIYYRSIQAKAVDHLRVRDYLWRWDTDWFWCSRALQVQKPWVRPLVPKRFLRSDVYWKVIGFERRHQWKARLDARLGRPAQEPVVQDVEVPVQRLPEFLEFFHREIRISPVWVCPMRARAGSPSWTLFDIDHDVTWTNVGFWSAVDLPPGQVEGFHNRRIEEKVAELGGHKSLYSTAFYPEEEFWATYNGEGYHLVKKDYDPDGRLLDLYEKTVRRR